jgi:tRNA dimethylallyltransferase
MKERTVIVVAGPTAVGKTQYAVEIAKAFSGEIISADSMQIYRYMDIGSAKPAPAELDAVRHYLVSEIEPAAAFSVAEYQAMAKGYIETIFAAGKTPVAAGGTGLYLNSLICDMDFSVTPRQAGLREQLQREAEAFGAERVHRRLNALAPAVAERIHPNNLKRVIRAIEVFEAGGGEIREFSQALAPTKDYRCVLIGLSRERQELYPRLDRRVDHLMQAGLPGEVRALLDRGLTEDSISMKGIGYKEIIGHFHGEYEMAEAVRLIKRNTRRYAKRQMTWFRRFPDMLWFNLTEREREGDALSAILRAIRERLLQKHN